MPFWYVIEHLNLDMCFSIFNDSQQKYFRILFTISEMGKCNIYLVHRSRI